MFIGHYAVAFASRRSGSLPSLALMFIAVQLLDLLWPLFVLTGLETFVIEPGNTVITPLNFTHYPWSHSLLMTLIWAGLFGGGYYVFSKNSRGAWVLALLVCSHWVLDFITHRPDLQLTPFSETRVGLGLWNHKTAEIILEVGMFLIASWWYFTAKIDKRKMAFWALVVFFLAVHFMNLMSPPPHSVNAVAWSANLMWIFVVWAWWIEKKKTPKNGEIGKA